MIYKKGYTFTHYERVFPNSSLRGVSIQNCKGTRHDILDKLDKLL